MRETGEGRLAMRTFVNGAYYTVQCSTADVAAFKASWPCSGLPTRPIAFQYDKRNGDLFVSQCPRCPKPCASGLSVKSEPTSPTRWRFIGTPDHRDAATFELKRT